MAISPIRPVGAAVRPILPPHNTPPVTATQHVKTPATGSKAPPLSGAALKARPLMRPQEVNATALTGLSRLLNQHLSATGSNAVSVSVGGIVQLMSHAQGSTSTVNDIAPKADTPVLLHAKNDLTLHRINAGQSVQSRLSATEDSSQITNAPGRIAVLMQPEPGQRGATR